LSKDVGGGEEGVVEVPAAVLLKGAWYSVEQCGHLLHHAAILHRAKAYPTAAAVALLGREELGAYRFLREEWKKATETGVEPDADAIRDALQDHLLKQQRSVLGLTLTSMAGVDSTRSSARLCVANRQAMSARKPRWNSMS
jgi:AbiV family abortive infection protein